MELSPEQKKAIEQQKSQCIFCQIIAGKIPSNKVYEDNQVIGILDINPAGLGHVLLMPKEHYPIMPLIPPDTFKHLVDMTKEVDKCVKDALLCKETTIFIANGAAAGQQSSHFMLHIIPREGKDELELLDIKGKRPEEESKDIIPKVGPHLSTILARNLPGLGFEVGNASKEVKKEQIIHLIEANPQLKKIILESPEDFLKLAKEHPQLKTMFKDADINAIIAEVKQKNKTPSGGALKLDGQIK